MTKYNNPITIKKDSTPYLNLSEYSGIYINKYESIGISRGIRLPINSDENQNFSLLSFQMWIRYPEEVFAENLPVVTINGQSFTINLTANMQTDGKRAILEADTNLIFYQNGIQVVNPTIVPKQWNSIYIIFPLPLSFTSYAGEIVLHPEFIFNNLAELIYENEILENFRLEYKAWAQIYTPNFSFPSTHATWSSVNSSGDWADATSTSAYVNDFFADGEYLYNDQTGTSVVVVEDLSGIEIYSNGTDVFANVDWVTLEKPLV